MAHPPLKNPQLHNLCLLFNSVYLCIYLNLCSELLHLPPALRILSPNNLNDGGEHGHPHQDVDGADNHVPGFISSHKICIKDLEYKRGL